MHIHNWLTYICNLCNVQSCMLAAISVKSMEAKCVGLDSEGVGTVGNCQERPSLAHLKGCVLLRLKTSYLQLSLYVRRFLSMPMYLAYCPF